MLTYISGVFLHNQYSMTSRHKLLEDRCEILRHLLERQLNSLVLALVEVINQIFDRLLQQNQKPTFNYTTNYTLY